MATQSILNVIRRHVVPMTLIHHTGTALNAEGYPVPSFTSTTEDIHTQPMSGKDMDNLRRGQSVSEAINIWSEAALANKDQVTTPEGDTFTLQNVKFWREGPFYRAIGVSEDAPS